MRALNELIKQHKQKLAEIETAKSKIEYHKETISSYFEIIQREEKMAAELEEIINLVKTHIGGFETSENTK